MKITNNNINFYTKYNSIQNKKREITCPNQTTFKGLGALALFTKVFQNKETEFANRFFLKSGKPTKKDCEDVVNNHPTTVTKAYREVFENSSYRFDMTPNICAKAGYNLKKYFDNHFKNYRIISVGTSPANISQTMEYLGCEVVYLPISGAKGLYEETVRPSFLKKVQINELNNAKIVSEYFKSKLPKNDNKINILLDYKLSGKTLDVLSNILVKNTKTDKEKLEKVSLIRALYDAISENYSDNPDMQLTKKDIEAINSDCVSQILERASNVPHFQLIDRENRNVVHWEKDNYISSKGKTKNKIFQEFEKYSTKLGRAYGLCAYNELRKMGLV